MSIAVITGFNPDEIKNAVRLLKAHKSFKINGLYAEDFNKLQDTDEALFNSVAEFVKEGRWQPFVGAWNSYCELSPVSMIKSCLYSAQYFKSTFGIKNRVFVGKKVYNNFVPQIVYSSLFDAAYLTDETESKWIKGTDNFRTILLKPDTTDFLSLGEKDIRYNTFYTLDEFAENTFASHLDLLTQVLEQSDFRMNDIEKAILDAEFATASNGINKNKEIKNAWIALFEGDTDKAIKIASDAAEGLKRNDGFIKVNGDGVVISELKFAEDNSGDMIVRTRETKGTEKGGYILCPTLKAGFRFEIMPWEIHTFRISGDGMGIATEIFICE